MCVTCVCLCGPIVVPMHWQMLMHVSGKKTLTGLRKIFLDTDDDALSLEEVRRRLRFFFETPFRQTRTYTLHIFLTPPARHPDPAWPLWNGCCLCGCVCVLWLPLSVACMGLTLCLAVGVPSVC